ncbi:glucosyltransferase domain-containing protein [Ruminococcus flavefaciens]|uniref:glucosyltransferase domain-containing protein n=1 Tax=Ruminococcus flavefaciens TaxID=1265 RepID=UPI000491A3EC|nr:glucosyltransferase domain-containing protein [Ruminococcus flavefaciens]
MLNEKKYDIKRLAHFFAVSWILCTLAYIVLISNELTNTYDGLWKGSYDIGYQWVISIGRWFWPTIGRLRENYSPEPFTSMFSLACHVCGGIIVAYIFGLKDSFRGYIVVLISVVNTAVCSFLSYRYMSPTFAFAYLFAVIGAWQLRDCSVRSLIISIVMFTLSLGCYQMNIGCACVLILVLLLWYLQNEAENRKIVKFMGYAVVSMLISFISYKIIWDIFLKLNHVEASAYKSADKISLISLIKSFPKTFVKTYTTFAEFFFNDNLKQNVYENTVIFKVGIVVFLLLACAHIVSVARSKDQKRAIFALAAFILLPPAANAALILAPGADDFQIQMSLPMVLILPLLLCIIDVDVAKEKIMKNIEKAYPFAFVMLLAGNFIMISIDQHTMLSGRTASASVLNMIANDLDFDEIEGKECAFIGRISDNPMFVKDELWSCSNDYAQYGDIWLVNICSTQSYWGMMRDSGIKINQINDPDVGHELERSEEVKAMPLYPHDGCMKEIDGVIVIKLSEPEIT